jgi:phage terminase small subunit
LCQALHVRDRAYEQVLSGGIEVADAAHGGEPRRNPAIITWRQAADMATGLMNLLGLSPVSRARIQSADGEKTDPLTDFIRRRYTPDPE